MSRVGSVTAATAAINLPAIISLPDPQFKQHTQNSGDFCLPREDQALITVTNQPVQAISDTTNSPKPRIFTEKTLQAKQGCDCSNPPFPLHSNPLQLFFFRADPAFIPLESCGPTKPREAEVGGGEHLTENTLALLPEAPFPWIYGVQ